MTDQVKQTYHIVKVNDPRISNPDAESLRRHPETAEDWSLFFLRQVYLRDKQAQTHICKWQRYFYVADMISGDQLDTSLIGPGSDQIARHACHTALQYLDERGVIAMKDDSVILHVLSRLPLTSHLVSRCWTGDGGCGYSISHGEFIESIDFIDVQGGYNDDPFNVSFSLNDREYRNFFEGFVLAMDRQFEVFTY